MLRGIFDAAEDPQYWKDAIIGFPNKVPRFESKDEAEIFIRKYCEKGSNPVESHMFQTISTLTDWDQINKLLIPKIKEYEGKWPTVYADEINTDSNQFMSHNLNSMDDQHTNPVHDYLESRLNLPIHANMSSLSVINTLNYTFHHLKCGIYVMIRNNRVVIFCPYVNKNYTNTWSRELNIDSPNNNIETYYAVKENHYRRENIIEKNKWWANGNIICNEESKDYWGDHFLFQLKDMIAETCNQREIPDCDFFINKRDYPQLKYNMIKQIAVEPYGFIYDKDDHIPEEDVDLTRHLYKSYSPIL